MPATSDKRERLLEAANSLIYKQGFNQTTLADIARESGVPLGNVYYYFKTKDDIGRAVVDERVRHFQQAFSDWDLMEDPRERLLAFLGMPIQYRDDLAAHGCPVGSLCQELNKEEPTALADRADGLLDAQLDWVTEQFRKMGREDADDLGLQFIAAIQGAALLANSKRDAGVVDRIVARMKDWIRSL